MKLRSRLFVSVFFVFFLASCIGPRPSKSGPPYQVLLPWSKNGSDYSLQVVEIKTLQDLEQMTGDVAEVKIKYASNKNLPLAQFTQRNDGVFIPTDINSLQAAAAYAHTEKLYEMDRSLGIDLTFLNPRRIVIEAKVSTSFSKEEKDNAIYMGGVDTIYFVPYTMTDIPITANGGIIAHEHFHGIFWEYVMKYVLNTDEELQSLHQVHDNWYHGRRVHLEDQKDQTLISQSDQVVAPQDPKPEEKNDEIESNKEKEDKKELEFENKFMLLLQSLNEGLADYWGYIYSNREGFIEDSIKSQTIRNMSLSGTLWSKQYFKFFSECIGFHKLNKSDVVRLSYQLGSNHARLLSHIEKEIGREKVISLLVSILPKIKDELVYIKDKRQDVNFDLLIQLMEQEISSLSEPVENILKEYSIEQSAEEKDTSKDEDKDNKKRERFRCNKS